MRCSVAYTRSVAELEIDLNARVAIKLDHDGDPSWCHGAPYAVAEHSLDEYGLPSCHLAALPSRFDGIGVQTYWDDLIPASIYAVIGVDEHARRAGPDISWATIDGWLMKVGELLTPLAAVMRDELLRGSYIKADETPLAVQTSDGRPKLSCTSLRKYGVPGGAAVFEFRMWRGRAGPMRFLEDFDGILQTDAYTAYDRVGGPKMVHAASSCNNREEGSANRSAHMSWPSRGDL